MYQLNVASPSRFAARRVRHGRKHYVREEVKALTGREEDVPEPWPRNPRANLRSVVMTKRCPLKAVRRSNWCN